MTFPKRRERPHRQRPATSTNALARTAAADFWRFTDPELTDPARELKVVAGRTLKLYARNRLTLRCSFTDDSIDTSTLVLRTSPGIDRAACRFMDAAGFRAVRREASP